nr:hypothetical protein Iba_scaffold11865CG0010 [Ipomoea batatas]GME11554.1 hypothetical protein Iba_scaffold11866CG0010 [Ipomoea batatas]
MTYFGAVHTNNQWKMLIEKGSTQKDINAEVNATPTPDDIEPTNVSRKWTITTKKLSADDMWLLTSENVLQNSSMGITFKTDSPNTKA